MRWPWQKRCRDECQFPTLSINGWGMARGPFLKWVRCSRVSGHADYLAGEQHGNGSQFRWTNATPRTIEERTR